MSAPSLSPSRPARRDLAGLVDLVGSIAADTDLWRPRVHFEETGRWWTKLVDEPDVDVWLLTWLRDQDTDLHDHGGSSAAFTVVEGRLRELRPDGRRTPSFRREPGETVWVSPGVVHDVGNPWTAPAVSIHAYSPPLSQMTYYRQGSGVLTAVETRLADGPER